MPRRREVPERPAPPDPIYGSQLVTQFVHAIMRHGKRGVAEHILYTALKRVQEKSEDDPLKVFKRAVENVKPAMEVKSRRVGGSNYQVPVEVPPKRRLSLAMRWLISFAQERPERTLVEKLAAEFLDASQGRGGAMKKKEDVHRMAEANKAFAHYRW